jgi:hypothetical protein
MRVWVVPFLLLFGGCGYQSASHYAKKVVGESVSTEVVISMEDPQNTVIIKDAVDSAVITKFRSSLESKNSAKTHLKISISGVSFRPLRYDNNGYVVTYRTAVSMRILRSGEEKSGTYAVRGVHDFEIEPNAIISDQSRFEAIRLGAQKGIDAFIAQVAAQGVEPK